MLKRSCAARCCSPPSSPARARSTPTGAVAWAQEVFTFHGGAQVEIRRSGADDAGVLLDSAPGTRIDQRSLRLDGTTLSWLHAGERRTVELR